MNATTFQVRLYREFPVRRGSDKVVREFPDLETAEMESIFLNRKGQDRYYVQDLPHEEVDLKPKQRAELLEKYGLE